MRPTEPTLRLLRHDRLQLEVKVDLPVHDVHAKKLEYRVQLWFLLPKVVGIGPGSTDALTLYDDLRAFTRLKTPYLSLTEVTTTAEANAELTQELERLASATWDPGTEELIRREVRLLMRGYRSRCQEAIGALEQRREPARARALLAHSGDLALRYRAIVQTILKRQVTPETTLTLTVCDEYLSVIIDQNLIHALEILAAKGGEQALENELRAAARAEMHYRADRGWPTVLSKESSTQDEELYTTRISRLKKYVTRILHLRARPSLAHSWVRQAAFAAAAALAMTWAVAAQVFILVQMNIKIQRGASTQAILCVAVLLVAAYILKDRIKATLGNHFSRVLPRWFDDRWTLLTWRRDDRPIAKVAERMSFVSAEGVPALVEAQRATIHGDALDPLYNDDALLYSRRTIVRPRRARESFDDFIGLNDILRANVSRWCRTLASPKRKMTFLDEDGRLQRRRLHNRYAVDIVASLQTDGQPVRWSTGCMLLTQRGIDRVDAASVHDVAPWDGGGADD